MALFDTSGGYGGLLGEFGDYGLGLPRNTGGLIGDAERDAINKRALLSGGINAALTYFATPKNLNTGSALPYLGKAGLAGFGASQNTVDQALNMAYRNKMLAGKDDVFSNINPLDVTPESLKLYIEGGKKDPSLLRKVVAEDKTKYTDTYGNIALSMFGTDNPSKLTLEQRTQVDTEARRRALEKPPSTVINTGDKADVKFAEKVATDIAGKIGTSYDNAFAAINTKRIIGDIQQDIAGGIYAGPGSTTQTTLAQLGTKFGIVDQDIKKAAERTALTMQNLAKLELEAAQGMKGQGTLSDAERAILKRAAGGEIDKFNSNDLSVLVGALDKTSNYKIQSHQELMRRIPNTPSIRAYTDIYNLEIPEGINVTSANTSSNTQPPKANVQLPGGVKVKKVTP